MVSSALPGGHWEKASEFFDQMQTQSCKPDSITYSGLITAFERGGQWRRALKAFEQMQSQGCHPDAAVFNSLMEVLWQSGVILAQVRALQLWSVANRNGHFRCDARRGALHGGGLRRVRRGGWGRSRACQGWATGTWGGGGDGGSSGSGRGYGLGWAGLLSAAAGGLSRQLGNGKPCPVGADRT